MEARHNLIEAFSRLTSQEQDVLLAELSKRVIAKNNGATTISLTDSDGDFVGYLFGARRTVPPTRPLTPEEVAENARRLRNRYDAVSAEEIIALARAAGNRPTVGS